MYSVPSIQWCAQCGDIRNNIKHNYRMLNEVKVNLTDEETGVTREVACLDVVSNVELTIVKNAYQEHLGHKSAWVKSNCDRCYDDQGNLTTEFKELKRLHREVNLCFDNKLRNPENNVSTVKSRFNESLFNVKSRFKERNFVTKMKFYFLKVLI